MRRLPERLRPALGAFRVTVERVEAAKQALTDAVPTTRLPGRPLAEALVAFEDEIRAAAEAMPGWRTEQTADAWDACSHALSDALSSAERLRLEAEPPNGFEALIGAIDGLLAPLDAFAQAADRFRDLRVRR